MYKVYMLYLQTAVVTIVYRSSLYQLNTRNVVYPTSNYLFEKILYYRLYFVPNTKFPLI